MAKHSFASKLTTLDLHHVKPTKGETVEEAVIRILDRFMVRFLTKKTVDISIIVGKGLGSKKLIQGKNPLRYYTEQYLIRVGCTWTNGNIYSEGQEGVIRIKW
jgi:hypothetical protein